MLNKIFWKIQANHYVNVTTRNNVMITWKRVKRIRNMDNKGA